MDYERLFAEDSHLFRVSDVRRLLDLARGREVISFGGGLPELRVVDLDEVMVAVAGTLRKRGHSALQYSSTRGEPGLLDALVEYIEKDLGIALRDHDAIIVTTGSQQAIDVVARLFIDPGSPVVVEKPTYIAALNAFIPRSPKFIGVEIRSDEGFDVEELEKGLRQAREKGLRPRFLYTIPTYQNPAGSVLPDKARDRVYELAQEYGFVIVEDDPYRLLTLEDSPPRALKSLDDEGRVLYVSTLSKTLFPGLRIGFAIGHREIVERMITIKQALDLHTSTFTQCVAEELLRAGFHRRYLARVLPVYKRRRDSMLRVLEDSMEGLARWTRPKGGMFIFAWLDERIDTRRLLERAVERGIFFVPGSGFYYDGSGTNTMRLNFTYPSEHEIEKGIRVLGELVRHEVGGRG